MHDYSCVKVTLRCLSEHEGIVFVETESITGIIQLITVHLLGIF